MTALIFAALIFASVIALSGPVQAQKPAAAQTETIRSGIQTAYDQLNAAFLQRDLGRFMSYFTADYRVIDEKGAISDKDQARRHYQEQRRQITSMKSQYTLQSVLPTSEGALVTMKMHTDGTGEKRILFARLKGTFTNDLLVRDLWVSTPQGWRIKHRQTLSDQTHTHPG